MIDKAQGLLKSKAVSGTIVVTVGLVAGSFFSYLLRVMLGRALTVEEYGVFNALLSLSVILSVFNNSFMTSITKLVAELKGKERFDLLTGLFAKINIGLLIFGGVLFLGILFFEKTIASFFRIDDIFLIRVFGVFIAVSFAVFVPRGYLQGLLRFNAFSFVVFITNFLRFLIPMTFVYLGFSVRGVFGGMILAVALSYFIAVLILRKNFTGYVKEPLAPYYRKLLTFGAVAIFVRAGMNMLNNVDIMLVKHFFEANTAGVYSGVVTLGKILLFGAGTVAVVMFPLISESYSKGENYFSKLKPLLYLQFFAAALGVAVFWLFPQFITLVMFGEKFLPSVPYVPSFAVFMGLYIMVNFLVMFFLAVEKYAVAAIQVPVVAAQVILISIFHDSLYEIISINIVVAAFLLLILMIYYARNARFYHSSRVQAGKNNQERY